MKKITELNREILTLVENLRAGIVSVEKAEPLIKSAEMIIETYELARQYTEEKEGNSDLFIGFMEGEWLEDLPSKDSVLFVKRVVEMARRELEDKKKSLGS